MIKKRALKDIRKILVEEFSRWDGNDCRKVKLFKDDLEQCKSFREVCDASDGWGYYVTNKTRRLYRSRKT